MFWKIVLGIAGTLAALILIGKLTPEKPKPELLAMGIVACKSQDAAVALARALSTSRGNSEELSKWSQQNGCDLVPAGTYVTPIEEEAGHVKITKVSSGTREMYLLGLPRATPQERLNAAVEGLKKSVSSFK